ncbi:hypothetical protein C8R41DRAFT_810021 [Lentinula lateritia]|uniref:Uncharacterized protein n=1 Tax=Lentinula lateritia TaxID=40482 RepID=A0ABQ8VW10_9AGAR|nr:hypothetical protein C8R41DRAFT_810021 [Lentinula lateritia]
MPECGVYASFHWEIQSKQNEHGESGLPASNPFEHGYFVVHPECCALPTGQRQNVRLHQVQDGDPDFLPLPTAQKQSECDKKGVCTACQPPTQTALDTGLVEKSSDLRKSYKSQGLTSRLTAAQIVNKLNIRGQLFSALRGKEITIGIGDYLIRISFATEAHCFWILTEKYRTIISCPTVSRGATGKAFPVPDELLVNCPQRSQVNPLLATIPAAFVRPKWTLLFLDHQCFITFHIMRLQHPCSESDFIPSSPLWHRFWSRNHGPVYSSQPQETENVLEQFRREMSNSHSMSPIWSVMKERQDIFNGFGAQESCDTLFLALIHPLMPAQFVCSSKETWTRFRSTVIEQHMFRIQRILHPDMLGVSPLAYLSKESDPFKMNKHAHEAYAATIPCYRKKTVLLSSSQLDLAHKLGLFNKDGVLGEDGIAQVPATSFPPASSEIKDVPSTPRSGYQSCKLPNYIHRFNIGSRFQHVYSPFFCRLPESWFGYNELWGGVIDFKHCVNETTLGPYSFKVFVDCAWSKEHIEVAGGETVLIGRRPILKDGTGNSKRPKKGQIPSGKEKSRVVQKNRMWHLNYGTVENQEWNDEDIVGESELLEAEMEGEDHSGAIGTSGPIRPLRSQRLLRKDHNPY